MLPSSSLSLPNWSTIKAEHPDLAERLRANRYDHDSLVEYLALALGGTLLNGQAEPENGATTGTRAHENAAVSGMDHVGHDGQP